MIDKNKLFELAKVKHLKPWQQEKHFIQAVILVILADYPLIFKGGTYLWFFYNLPRFSEDLDFTVSGTVLNNLPKKVSRALEFFGIENSVKLINESNVSLSFRISAKGPLNSSFIDECRVYVEISKREKNKEKTVSLKLDFPEYNLPVKRIRGMNLNEVVAEKIRALFTRNKARDLFDLYYLVEKNDVVFDKKLVNKKLGFYNQKFSKKLFFKKMAEKEKHYKKELKNLVFDELPEFKKTINTIKKWLDSEIQKKQLMNHLL